MEGVYECAQRIQAKENVISGSVRGSQVAAVQRPWMSGNKVMSKDYGSPSCSFSRLTPFTRNLARPFKISTRKPSLLKLTHQVLYKL